MTNVTYILGAGRCGSTLLDRLLGSAPGALSLGEVHSLWRMDLDELTCSCGAPGAECSFWNEILHLSGLGPARLAALRRLEGDVIRHKTIASAGFSLSRFHADRAVQRFVAMQRDLFGAISDFTGAVHLIDSSKAAPRAWALSGLENIQIVHMHRNPGAIASSWRSRKHDPSLQGPMRQVSAAAAFGDWARAGASARALARQRTILRLNYETLVDWPRNAIRQVFGADIADQLAWEGPAKFSPDPDYHALNGNPDRFQKGVIRIAARQPIPLKEVALR